MSKASYDEENDILYISFSNGAYSDVVNTEMLTLYLDKNGTLKRIAIKNAKRNGILDSLSKLLASITI
ncbi:MAG: hypothetical protein KatS3mg003_1407 [Candidatus Nitrosocaldaceae archaeon]|nr:MAG: hypothetical protein KatS3mg003_1407 [Candidatus Nitrosocaldaceae archaeon]